MLLKVLVLLFIIAVMPTMSFPWWGWDGFGHGWDGHFGGPWGHDGGPWGHWGGMYRQ